MSETNATVKQTDEIEEIKVPINSIQTQAYVKRLAIFSPYGLKNVYWYDVDNLYPQKILSIRDRSWSLSSATKTFSDFITGDGFQDDNLNKLVINRDGETMYKILRHISDEKNVFGFSVHVNYNLDFKVVEINKIDFEDLRISKRNKIVYNKDWSNYSRYDSEEYDRFNPDPVVIKQQIEEAGGIEEWNGQVLYWTGTNKIYPLATFDAALDPGQYQAEVELFKLRNVQNDFSASGALHYPKNLDKDKEWAEVKRKLKRQGTGGNNAGKMVLIGTITDSQTGGNQKFWESFERNNVDKLFEIQNREAKEAIFSTLRQPQILGGVKPDGGWPNQQELEDAFVYYNSIVEQDRDEVAEEIKMIIESSIWSEQFKEFNILPKSLIKKESTGVESTNNSNNGTE